MNRALGLLWLKCGFLHFLSCLALVAFALVHWSHATVLPLPELMDRILIGFLMLWTLGFPPLGSAVWGHLFARWIFSVRRKRQLRGGEQWPR